jgi:SIR2-like domain
VIAQEARENVIQIERLPAGEALDPNRFERGLLRRMQDYGYLTPDHRRASGLDRLKHALRSEGLVLFLGAGVSKASGIPGWRELLDALLADMVSFPEASSTNGPSGSASLRLESAARLPMTSQFDLVAHDCKEHDREHEFVDRLRAGLYGQKDFAGTRELLNAIPEDNEAKKLHDWTLLRAALDKNETLAATGELLVHALMGSQPTHPKVHAVLTTNVDNLLQIYVMSKVDGKRLLDTVSDPGSRETPGNIPVYHLHGWLDMRERREGGAVREPPLVFRESEYFSTIASPHSFANHTSQHFFQRRRLLFIGTSLEDLNVRRWLFNAFEERRHAHLGRLRARFPAHTAADSEAYAASIRHFWFKNASELPEPRPLVKEFFGDTMRHLGVEVIWYETHAQVATWLRELARTSDTVTAGDGRS